MSFSCQGIFTWWLFFADTERTQGIMGRLLISQSLSPVLTLAAVSAEDKAQTVILRAWIMWIERIESTLLVIASPTLLCRNRLI